MFCAGDEFLNTQGGNNNPYNQDNETTWLDWDRLEANREIFRFFQMMIAFRKAHPTIARSRFWRDDVRWYGSGQSVDMSHQSRHLAFYLDGTSQDDVDLYVMINAHRKDRRFEIQEFGSGRWKLVVDTSRGSPQDILAPGQESVVSSKDYTVRARSVVVLMRERP
jgi:glycogen operon protein